MQESWTTGVNQFWAEAMTQLLTCFANSDLSVTRVLTDSNHITSQDCHTDKMAPVCKYPRVPKKVNPTVVTVEVWNGDNSHNFLHSRVWEHRLNKSWKTSLQTVGCCELLGDPRMAQVDRGEERIRSRNFAVSLLVG